MNNFKSFLRSILVGGAMFIDSGLKELKLVRVFD